MSKLSKEIQNKIVDLYNKKHGSPYIAKELGISTGKVSYFIKKNLTSRSHREANSRYYFNEKFFNKIDTEEKAYWLGFLMADGYISKNNNSYKIGLTLSTCDYAHLEKLNKSLESNHPIKTYEPTKSSYSKNSYSRIIYYSETMFNDLLKYNLVEHKTNVLIPPDISLLENYVSDFIRGYFDGNGSITHTNTELSNSYAFKLVSTKKFLDFVNNYIEEKLGFSANKYYKRKNYQEVMSLEFGGNLKTQKILDLLYKNATIYLNRKYQRYLDLCNLNNSRALEKSKV